MAATREQVVQAAEKYVARGKIEPAIREYRKLLADNPNDINTLNRIGDLYARIQRIDEAVDFFTQIAEQYTAEGFFVKAIAIYKKIIKLDPTRLEVYEQLAELYHKQGLVNEARTQYQVLADYYVKHQNAASAIAIYQKMVQLEPENPTYHVKLAEIYHQQQLIEKAMGEYRIIAELMIQHGRPQEAAQVYERALDIDSQNLGFIEDAVHNLREADHAAGADRFLTAAIERNPQAEQIARKLRESTPAAAPVAEVEVEAEPEAPEIDLDILAEPEPVTPGFGAIQEEDDFSFSLDVEDDLSRAMAEAAAAVGGAPAPVVSDPESEEIELDLEGVFGEDVLEVEVEDDEPASLVRPPADMLGTPARPAWSQDSPVPGAAFAQPPATAWTPADAEPVEEIELDLDLDDPFGAVAAEAEPPAAHSFETGVDPFAEGGEWTSEPPPWMDAMVESEAPAAATFGEPMAEVVEAPAPAAPEPEREEALDLITEAEVLAKYGLEDKAVERLNEAVRLHPEHLQAYVLLIQIHLDKGRHPQVIELANRMSDAASRKANREPWQRIRQKLADAGYRLEGDQVLATPQVARANERPAGQVDYDLLRDILGTPTPRTPKAPAARPQPAPAPPPEAPVPEPVWEPLPEPAPEPVFLEPALSEPVFDEPAAFEPEPLPFAAAPVAPAPPPPAAPARSSSVFDPLQIGELVESETEDWSTLDVPLPGAPAQPVSVAPSRDVLDDTGSMSWLDEADRHREEKGPAAGGEIFDEEDDFFDLAGELVEELSREEVFQRDGVTIQSEQSLEDIVEGFKKGVAEHLSPTDYDTHFNLGIAYREMGLLDEAIGEFQLAAKDPGHLVLCCSMLGLCFLDKGLPDLAVKWYRRALESPSIHEEDQLGMLYDLGNVYMQLGDNVTAYNTFAELYGINAHYRDVVAKLEELGPR